MRASDQILIATKGLFRVPAVQFTKANETMLNQVNDSSLIMSDVGKHHDARTFR